MNHFDWARARLGNKGRVLMRTAERPFRGWIRGEQHQHQHPHHITIHSISRSDWLSHPAKKENRRICARCLLFFPFWKLHLPLNVNVARNHIGPGGGWWWTSNGDEMLAFPHCSSAKTPFIIIAAFKTPTEWILLSSVFGMGGGVGICQWGDAQGNYVKASSWCLWWTINKTIGLHLNPTSSSFGLCFYAEGSATMTVCGSDALQ